MASVRKQKFFDRFPSYVPLHYRLLAWLRRACRQTFSRLGAWLASRQGNSGVFPDGPGHFVVTSQDKPFETAINKAAFWMDDDLARANVMDASQRLAVTKEKMVRAGLSFCSAAGTFVNVTYTSYNEKKKLWEDAWVLAHAQVRPGLRILDIGGASTPFSFCLADMGCSVTVVDNDWGNCGTIYNVDHVARKTGWDIKGIDRDIACGLPFSDHSFDRVFSICVMEHLTSSTRRLMMKEVGRVLKPGGIVGITIDYDHERKVVVTDKGLRFGYPQKFYDDVIVPSGLSLMGNTELLDLKPDEDFLGAFFLKKS